MRACGEEGGGGAGLTAGRSGSGARLVTGEFTRGVFMRKLYSFYDAFTHS